MDKLRATASFACPYCHRLVSASVEFEDPDIDGTSFLLGDDLQCPSCSQSVRYSSELLRNGTGRVRLHEGPDTVVAVGPVAYL